MAASQGNAPRPKVSKTPILLLYEPAICGSSMSHAHKHMKPKVLPDLEVINLMLAGEVRFELTTHGLTVRCANHYATLPCGALGWIRTNDHPIISRELKPTELLEHIIMRYY